MVEHANGLHTTESFSSREGRFVSEVQMSSRCSRTLQIRLLRSITSDQGRALEVALARR